MHIYNVIYVYTICVYIHKHHIYNIFIYIIYIHATHTYVISYSCNNIFTIKLSFNPFTSVFRQSLTLPGGFDSRRPPSLLPWLQILICLLRILHAVLPTRDFSDHSSPKDTLPLALRQEAGISDHLSPIFGLDLQKEHVLWGLPCF